MKESVSAVYLHILTLNPQISALIGKHSKASNRALTLNTGGRLKSKLHLHG